MPSNLPFDQEYPSSALQTGFTDLFYPDKNSKEHTTHNQNFSPHSDGFGIGLEKRIPGAVIDSHDMLPFPFHPLENEERLNLHQIEINRIRNAANAYGSHAAFRMRMERELISQCRRLPGIESSLLGLQTLMGFNDTLEFHDVYNCETPQPTDAITTLQNHLETQWKI